MTMIHAPHIFADDGGGFLRVRLYGVHFDAGPVKAVMYDDLYPSLRLFFAAGGIR